MRGRGAVGSRLYELLGPFPWAEKSQGDVHFCASFWYFAWYQHTPGAEDDVAGVRSRVRERDRRRLWFWLRPVFWNFSALSSLTVSDSKVNMSAIFVIWSVVGAMAETAACAVVLSTAR